MNGVMTMCNPLKRIPLQELMNGGKKVILEHGDKPYLLSITRKGKLILTAAEQAVEEKKQAKSEKDSDD